MLMSVATCLPQPTVEVPISAHIRLQRPTILCELSSLATTSLSEFLMGKIMDRFTSQVQFTKCHLLNLKEVSCTAFGMYVF